MTENLPNPPPSDSLECPICGAPLRRGDTRCWLCGAIEAKRSQTSNAPPPLPLPLAAPSEPVSRFSLSSMMMFVTLLCVLLGVITIAPGLGIPMAIVAFFAWMHTTSVVGRRAAIHRELVPQQKFMLFMRSFVSATALLMLVAVAAGAALISALYVSCAAEASQDPHKSEYALDALISAAVTVGAIFASVKIVQAMRRRWRRDIGEPD